MTSVYLKAAGLLITAALVVPCFQAGADIIQKRIMKEAVKAYHGLHYQEVVNLLENEVSYKRLSRDLIAEEMLANSLRKLERTKDAVFWYRRLVHSRDPKPSWFLHYAQMLGMMEMYDSAAVYYAQYARLAPHDKRGEAFAKAYEHPAELAKGARQYQIWFANINTDAAEYSPCFYKEGLLFVSNRRVNRSVKHVFGWNQSPYSDIYMADSLSQVVALEPDSIIADVRRNPKKYRKQLHALKTANREESPSDSKRYGYFDPTMFGDTLGAVMKVQGVHHLAGRVNSRFHEGPMTVMPDSSLLFTRSSHTANRFNRSDEDGLNKLQISYTTNKHLKVVDPFKYNDEDYTSAHPAVSKDGMLLIFASDMPGTQGGLDLYYCLKDKSTDQWSAPVNMGPMINTKGNEIFPFIDHENRLFFASDGHPGLGGLDVFSILLKAHSPDGEISHLGAPVNSSRDDFGFIWSDELRYGFFSSNRRGNDDIYIVK